MNGKRSCVIFGAGALGLGFLGPELHRDYRLVFADIGFKADILALLKEHKEYSVNESGPACRVLRIAGVDGVNMETAPEELAREVAHCALIFTAVGEPNLGKLAPTLLRTIMQRPGSAGPARILCCENGINIAQKMRSHLAGAGGDNLAESVLIGDTVMGRMCQFTSDCGSQWAPLHPGVSSAVIGEPFFGMPVEEHVMAGFEDPGCAFQICSPERFHALEDLKMFAHNGLHAFLAALGYLRSRRFFYELTGEADIMNMAGELLHSEVGPALLKKHNGALDRNEYLNYAPTITRRITCTGLRDSIERGVRGALRKLQPWERLISGIRCVKEQGGQPVIYARGVAAACEVARLMGETNESTPRLLTEHCRLDPECEADLIDLVMQGQHWLEHEFLC